MANRKKTKEEKASKSKVKEVASNTDEKIDWNKVAEEIENSLNGPSTEAYEKSELNDKASELLEQELKEAAELEELSQLQNDQVDNQEEIPDSEEQVVDPEPKEEKPKLHVLADDRLNSLINRANELGITDVVQIINSEKYGQFYLVYRE